MLHVGQKKQNLNHKRNILVYMRLVSTASGCHRDKLYPLWCFLIYIQNSTSVIPVPIYVLFEVWMVTLQGMLQFSPSLPSITAAGRRLLIIQNMPVQYLQASFHVRVLCKWKVIQFFQVKEMAFLSKTSYFWFSEVTYSLAVAEIF